MTTDSNKNPGCLGVILRIFGILPREVSESASREGPDLPYRIRDDFLSAAENSFYHVLCAATRDQAIVCPKVNLADVFFVVRPNENQAYRNKIDRRHVDFLLCDPKTMHPKVGLELDDASHERKDRQVRDEFLDSVFKVAGLPLVHIPVSSGYSISELSSLIDPYMEPSAEITAPPSERTAQPSKVAAIELCPKCGVPMVLRTASSGKHINEKFLGCPNYPKCREILPLKRESATV
jgi:hypothetical protein